MHIEQETLTNNTFITAAKFNEFVTNIVDHNTRLNSLISGGGTNANVTIGMIFMWFGDLSELESAWHVCDGTNGTPDLRDVFILGAGNTYAVGESGGMSVHNHTIGTTGSGGGHSHSYSFTTGGPSLNMVANQQALSVPSGSHTHTAPSKTTGSASSHTHGTPDTGSKSGLPPYKGIYYIMRIK